MREFPRTDEIGCSDQYKFLIEEEGELAKALQVVIDKEEMGWGSVRGKDNTPTEYPYIVCIYPEEEYGTLSLAFVTRTDFEESSNLSQHID